MSFNAADSVGLVRSTARKFVFNTGKHWIASDRHVRIERKSALLAYVRGRTRRMHERLTLDSLRFYGWRGRRLGFMPYYHRKADDLGRDPIPGRGKAEYLCAEGVWVLNLAPVKPILVAPSNEEL